MGILAVLSGAIVLSSDNAREKGKDARRKQDMQAIKSALVSYYADHKLYPPDPSDPTTIFVSNDSPTWIPDLTPYIQKLPKDPLQAGLFTELASTLKNSITEPIGQLAQNILPKKQPGPSHTQSEPAVAGTFNVIETLESGNDDIKYEPYEGAPPGSLLKNSPVDAFGKPFPDSNCGEPCNPGTRNSALRYNDVAIPQGADITDAYVRFHARDYSTTYSGGGNLNGNDQNGAITRIKILAEKSVNPAQISNVADWNNRHSSITGQILWDNVNQPNPAEKLTTWNGPYGNYYNSPQLKAIVQELVNQPTWTNGNNAIMLFFEDNGSTLGFNSTTGKYTGAGRSPHGKDFQFSWDKIPYSGENGITSVGRDDGGDGVGPVLYVTYSVDDPTLTCSPPNQTINLNVGANLTATGGTGTYSWAITSGTGGSLTTTTGASTTATFTQSGSKVVRVTSGSSTSDCNITVTAPPLPPPDCTPATQNINVGLNGTVNATGGNSIYAWSAPEGNPSSGTGPSFTTYYSTIGTKTVTVSSNGQSDNCTIVVVATGGEGEIGTEPDPSLCANKEFVFCYVVSPNRKRFVLWAQIENINDPDIYNKPSATCTDTPPANNSGLITLNFCLKSPN